MVGFRTTPGLVPTHPRALVWDTLSVSGPLSRTVGDAALMLSAMAGPDDRAPLSYEVDTSQFVRAVKTPSIKGWRIAWTPDLHGLIPVDEEVAQVCHDAVRVLRGLGARVTATCPDFSEVTDIVRGTRAVTMVALHADKLPGWRERMQRDLVQDIEQGLTLTATEIARSEVLRSVLWHRVRAFMATRDLLVLPTVAVPPFPVEKPYPTEIDGKPLESYFQWFYLTYGITLTGLPHVRNHLDRPACDLGAVWLHAERIARRHPDRRAPSSGGCCSPGCSCTRGGGTLGPLHSTGGHRTSDETVRLRRFAQSPAGHANRPSDPRRRVTANASAPGGQGTPWPSGRGRRHRVKLAGAQTSVTDPLVTFRSVPPGNKLSITM